MHSNRYPLPKVTGLGTDVQCLDYKNLVGIKNEASCAIGRIVPVSRATERIKGVNKLGHQKASVHIGHGVVQMSQEILLALHSDCLTCVY